MKDKPNNVFSLNDEDEIENQKLTMKNRKINDSDPVDCTNGNRFQYKDYTAQGQYQTKIDARGNTWKYSYDAKKINGVGVIDFLKITEIDNRVQFKRLCVR